MADSRLARLFEPASIAYVGGRRAELAASHAASFGYSGQTWHVHPAGRYPNLSDLPEIPDAVFVGVAAEPTIDIVAEAARLGVGGAVIYAAGFGEIGDEGREREQRLLVAAAGMPLVGPNCHGIINARTGAVMWPDVHGCARVERGVGIISQSGNVAIDLTMQQRGLPIAAVVSLGNQASVPAAEWIEAMAADPTITAIGLHLEGIVDSLRFADACRQARHAGKQVVVLKAGATERGAIIAKTHTASLAGSAAAHRALFARCGVAQVETPEQLLGALSIATTGAALVDGTVVSLSCSGGEASLIADLAESTNLLFPAFSPAAKARLDSILEGRGAITNPLDYHTFIWGDTERMERCFTAALIDGAETALLVIDFPTPGLDDRDWWPTLDAFTRSVAASGVTGVVTSTLPENLPKAICEHAAGVGMAPVPGLPTALAAIDAAISTPVGARHIGPPPMTSATSLDEAAAKQLMAEAGLPVPVGQPATAARAGLVADEVGFPVVLKSLSSTHRTDVGGIAVGITNQEQLATELARMAHLGDTFLIERKIEDVVGELLVGIRIEPPVGWTLTIGAGGVLAELLADTVTQLLPAQPSEIAEALEQLAIYRILAGFRNRPAGDISAALDVITRISELAVTRNFEIEVNPLLVCRRGVWIGDSLMEQWT